MTLRYISKPHLLESPYLVSEFIMCKHGQSLSVIILLMVYEPRPLLPSPPPYTYVRTHTHTHTYTLSLHKTYLMQDLISSVRVTYLGLSVQSNN